MHQYALQNIANVGGRNSQGIDPAFVERGISTPIVRRSLLKIMCQTVDFNRQASGLAKEVEDEGSLRMLSPKYQTRWA